MFYYLNGTVATLENDLAVIDCGGVGYACYTTTNTLSRLRVGGQQMLYTHCNVKEDAFDIYGFATKEELNLFRLLLGVSGVGPKAAIAILSVLTPEQLTLAVMTGDERALTQANGVGKKMAQRVLLELKDKLGAEMTQPAAFAGATVPKPNGKLAEATSALSNLGFSSSEIGAALRGIDIETLPLEDIIRSAFRELGKER